MSYSDEGSSYCDTDLIEIVSKCRNLAFLVIINYFLIISESFIRFSAIFITQTISRPITTGALLTVTAIGKNLQEIRVKKSYTIRKCDEWIMQFGQNNDLSTQWLQENFDSWDRVECAISNYLSKSWHFLNDWKTHTWMQKIKTNAQI